MLVPWGIGVQMFTYIIEKRRNWKEMFNLGPHTINYISVITSVPKQIEEKVVCHDYFQQSLYK